MNETNLLQPEIQIQEKTQLKPNGPTSSLVFCYLIVFNGMDMTSIITNKISKASQMIITPVKVAAFLINLFAKANYP